MSSKEHQEISIRKAFDDVFGIEDKYFGEWFINTDDTFTDFLENQITSKEIFYKQLRYLYLYLESLEILKRQAEKEGFSIAKLMSRDAWYCTVLLLLIGLVDQHTKSELNLEGKPKKLNRRFEIVLNSLEEEKQRDFIVHYNGSKFKKIEELAAHLYSTRTFFAHDVVMPSGGVPQDGYLGIDSHKLGRVFVNMPHGRIFLTVTIALLRYLGFKGKLTISSNKKFESFTDMLRKT